MRWTQWECDGMGIRDWVLGIGYWVLGIGDSEIAMGKWEREHWFDE